MSAPGLEANIDFINATYDEYFSKSKRGLAMTNELLRNSYVFSGLMDDKIDVQGGNTCQFDCLMRKSGNVGFASAGKTREVKSSKHNVRGSANWSVFETGFTIDDIEDLLNSGEFQIFDLIAQREEGMLTEGHNLLEETFFDSVGNADRISGEDPPFQGLKFHVTRHGRHVDGSSTVNGVDTALDKRWLNRYCGPLGSNFNKDFTDSTAETITSGNQLLDKVEKALMYCRFKSPNDLKMGQDDKVKAMIAKQKIWVDMIGYEALRVAQRAIGNGRDQIQPEEMVVVGEPTIRGLPVTWIEDLGLGSGGVPSYCNSVSAGSGATAVVAGAYANTGECFLVNQANLKVIGHTKAFPQKKPMQFLAKEQVAWQLMRWLMSVVCNSRQRQCCIWGFTPINRG